ncbi:phenylalanyl-tRNA synthetase subunit beta [mine drainage metagenome]|uniref:phenylalanine--tRNA ligase n=1 Tax=mine drainage metagenome TaxID=410659 RepID=T0Z982_9ZZZZ
MNVLGVPVKPADAVEYLQKMGLLANTTKYPLEVQVPGYRNDIMGEVDLIEDLAKSMRYSSIPEKTISLPLTGRANPLNDFSDIIRSIFLGAGFQEVMTFVVGAPSIYNEFGIKSGFGILNPKSSDFSFIRAALYPGLLAFLKHNKNRSVPQRIFEIGHVITDGIERTKACLMIIGPKANYASIKSAADAIMQRISGTKGEVRQASHAAIIEGRGGDLIINDENVGTIGEMHPAHLKAFDLDFPVCFLELDLDLLCNQRNH